MRPRLQLRGTADSASRRRRSRIAAVALPVLASATLLAAGPGVSFAGPAAATNLLVNPGFETGSLSGWSCAPTDSVTTSPAHSGTYALAGAASGSDDAQCEQTVSVQPNSGYTLSGYVEGDYVFLGEAGGGVSAWTVSATNWQRLTASFTTGATTTAVTIYVHGWYGEGTYYADDLALTGAAGSGTTGGGGTTGTTGGGTTGSTGGGATGTTGGGGGGTTGSTGGGTTGGGGWRSPVYLMPLDNDPPAASSIASAMSASGEKDFILAFVLDSGGCTPAWDGDSGETVAGDTAVAGLISAIRSAGGDVGVSFGGYNGTELGQSCGSASALAAAYQSVISKYKLTHVDFDIENTALGDSANELKRFEAIAMCEKEDPGLSVSLTIPVTSIGLPGSGTDEISQAIKAGARVDIINAMDFDYGLTSGTQVSADETVASDVHAQLESLYGWASATAWSHLGLTLMNGHTDQPSELFTQATFSSLLGYAQQEHVAWLTFWAFNRDRACPPGAQEPWAPGTCGDISQSPYDFTKIITRYTG